MPLTFHEEWKSYFSTKIIKTLHSSRGFHSFTYQLLKRYSVVINYIFLSISKVSQTLYVFCGPFIPYLITQKVESERI